METLKVSSKSNPNSVAGALANVMREKKEVEIQAPKKVKYQCLHTEEARECTCIRSKGLVLKK